ncbi:MAG: serine/threonine-protein kinase, partial [Myxococcota bacterium]
MTGTTQTVGSSDEERESSEPLLAPDQILDGTYRIRSMLGAGGMGQVFSARDLNLDCDVAIKVSWPHVPRGNLRREGMALAALRHPGLVAVYAMGHHKGLDYLVMERLYGLSLHDHLYHRGKAHPFSVAEGLEVLIGVADTLAVIHRGGYVHRDLKPGNIMLAPGHRIVLFDLGISLRADQAVKIERLAGSPHYMAPDGITMSIAQDQGHLIDIYALGVIAYEML